MIVPITQGQTPAQRATALPAPKPEFALMAAAQMHAEGRLFKPEPGQTNGTQTKQNNVG